MGFFKPIKGILIASRIPNLIIIGLTQFLSIYMLMRHGFIVSIGLPFVFLTVSTMMVAAGGYIINDYYDAKIDMVNRPGQVVVGRTLSRRKALAFHLSISLLAILLGLLVTWKLALVHFFGVTLLWYYSNRLRRYFIGKLVIALVTAGNILLVGFTYGVDSYLLMTFAAFGSAIVWVRELVKDMENVRGERAYGVESVPEVWGIKGAKLLIGCIGGIGWMLLAYFIFKVDSQLILYYYLAFIPLLIVFIVMLIRADRQEQFRQIRHLTNFLILVGLVSMLLV